MIARQLGLRHNMATLVRDAPPANSVSNQQSATSNVHITTSSTAESDLASTVPAPFPTLQGSIQLAPLNDPAVENQVPHYIVEHTMQRADEPTTERLDRLIDSTEQVSNVLSSDRALYIHSMASSETKTSVVLRMHV